MVRTIIAAAAVAALLAACSNTPRQSETASHGPAGTSAVAPTSAPTGAGFADTFTGADGPLNGAVAAGRTLTVYSHPGQSTLVTRSHRLVRTMPDTFGPLSAPILLIPDPAAPSAVSARFVFTAGRTARQMVVIGATAALFSRSSVQLAVSPARWILFYTLVRPSGGTAVVHLAEGHLGRMLAVDGRTVYAAGLARAGSCVTVTAPTVRRRVCAPPVARYWGAFVGVQIQRVLATDGQAAVTEIAAQ